MYLSVGHITKSTKKLKCTLNNKIVSLKHVATSNIKDVITCVSRHGLHNL